MSWKFLAELLTLLSAIVLWRQAYRASLIKLSRGNFVAISSSSGFGKLKQWLAQRQEKRDQNWSETDHRWLIAGLAVAVIACLIRLFTD
jgi:hypothetical protein